MLKQLQKQAQEPAQLSSANVVFGHASRGLDHAAVQEISDCNKAVSNPGIQTSSSFESINQSLYRIPSLTEWYECVFY